MTDQLSELLQCHCHTRCYDWTVIMFIIVYYHISFVPSDTPTGFWFASTLNVIIKIPRGLLCCVLRFIFLYLVNSPDYLPVVFYYDTVSVKSNTEKCEQNWRPSNKNKARNMWIILRCTLFRNGSLPIMCWFRIQTIAESLMVDTYGK